MDLNECSMSPVKSMMKSAIFYAIRIPSSEIPWRSISIDAKILISLKCIAYGTAINAFRDYFQMGESTSRLCVQHFARGILGCDAICNKYFRKMSPADAKRVEQMHYDAHGIHGMAFSIDCTHFFGGKCPTKYHGQYKGKESDPTVVVEAGCDYVPAVVLALCIW
jgi:hypothetical protein